MTRRERPPEPPPTKPLPWPQRVGLAGMVVMLAFWAATAALQGHGQTSPVLIGAFGALATGGEIRDALREYYSSSPRRNGAS